MPTGASARLETALTGAWARRGPLAWALTPLAGLYGALSGLRGALYRAGWLRRTRLPAHVTDQQFDRSQHPHDDEVSRHHDDQRCRGVGGQERKGRGPTLGDDVADIKLRDDLADIPALDRECRSDPDDRLPVAGRDLVHRHGAVGEVLHRRIHRRTDRICRRKHPSPLVGHDREQDPLARRTDPGTVQRVVDFPDVLVQRERPERHRQPFDMQPRELSQP
ncbi:MAG: tetraacyldisaccharide 4'-kinase [Ottowia sp.]|nr:tetraacyldisaccharide 4'-kinase [Ottowia sp.]